MKEKILQLKKEHPDWGYKKISTVLGCSRNTVKYHLNPTEKIKAANRVRKSRTTLKQILKRKKDQFVCDHQKIRYPSEFEANELYEKITSNPICYLTGDKIDLMQSRSFELDHIQPRSKGGSNSLENCGLTTKSANRAKADLNLDEFLKLCEKVLKNYGYSVLKLEP